MRRDEDSENTNVTKSVRLKASVKTTISSKVVRRDKDKASARDVSAVNQDSSSPMVAQQALIRTEEDEYVGRRTRLSDARETKGVDESSVGEGTAEIIMKNGAGEDKSNLDEHKTAITDGEVGGAYPLRDLQCPPSLETKRISPTYPFTSSRLLHWCFEHNQFNPLSVLVIICFPVRSIVLRD